MVTQSMKEEVPPQDVSELKKGSSHLASDPTIRRNLDIMDSLHKHIGKTEKIGLLVSILRFSSIEELPSL